MPNYAIHTWIFIISLVVLVATLIEIFRIEKRIIVLDNLLKKFSKIIQTIGYMKKFDN